MADFTQIQKVIFPNKILVEAFDFLREVGFDGYEAVTLFAGVNEGRLYKISKLYIPRQKSYKTPDGLMYHVSSEELALLDDWLFDNNISLFCQMHTHPREAYHSFADDKNCIVTNTGGISIVIPNFAMDPIDLSIWAVYRLIKNSGWTAIENSQLHKFIEIV
jgi:hypothetical protein